MTFHRTILFALALLAIGAPVTAQAKEFTAPEYPALPSAPAATQTFLLGPEREVTCGAEFKFDPLTESSPELTAQPSTDTCEFVAGTWGSSGALTVDAGCHFTFVSTPTPALELTCGPEEDLELHYSVPSSSCTYTIQPQVVAGVSTENQPGFPDKVVLGAEARLTMTKTKGTFLCGPGNLPVDYTTSLTVGATNIAGFPIDLDVG